MDYLEGLINNGCHKITLSRFLNYDEEATIASLRSCNVVFHNSFSNQYLIDSDYIETRKKAILYPKGIEYDELSFYDYEIDIYKLTSTNNFETLKHPQILGTIISLGISRDVIGDIIEADNCYYILVSSSISKYLELNLNKINNSFVEIEKVDKIEGVKANYIEETIMVSSMRLDSIICRVLNLSRNKAQDYVKDKYVKVNGTVVSKSDYTVKLNDVISITRGGRVIIDSVKGNTKKDKILLNIKRTKR